MSLKLGPEPDAYSLAARAATPPAFDYAPDTWGYGDVAVERRRRRGALAVLLALTLVMGGVLFLLLSVGGNNLHAVEDGRFYRSAQMNEADLSRSIDQLGIRCVLRLVGTDDSDRESYESERAVCERKGTRHVVAKMAASRLPWRSELSTLFAALDELAAREELLPVLVHCSQGSDRTGLVSVIWLHDYRGRPLSEARGQLAFVPYMHVSWGEARSMGDFLDRYEAFVRENPQSRLKIRDWVKLHYFEEKPGRGPLPWYDGKTYTPSP